MGLRVKQWRGGVRGWAGGGVQKKFGGEDRCDPLEMKAERKGAGCSKQSAAEQGMRLGVGLGGSEAEIKISSSSTYFPDESCLWVPRKCMLKFTIDFKLSFPL